MRCPVSRIVCLVRLVQLPHIVSLVCTMQDITDRQVAQAAAASALVLGLQSLYAWRKLMRSLLMSVNKGRTTWLFWPDPVQCSCCVVWLCVEISLAILWGLARAGRLAHMPELFLAWEGVPILAAEVFLVTRNGPVDLIQD